ncbi:hypothetical protein [Alteromonas sp. 14N.309.X.WAT.G.H12]|uniref:hypothetical protein n=1 Tax=Alteromonas sp. 14N.309.X.WAT.G.H12 TaxID=3120824 RepID=UPI002FCEB1CA
MKGLLKPSLLTVGLIVLAMLFGCTTTEFDPIVQTDGINHQPSVYIEPHLNGCKGEPVCTRIGAEWHDNKPNNVLFIVALSGMHTEITGAELYIDGDVVALNELIQRDEMLYRQYNIWSINWDTTHQAFLSSVAVAQRLANAESAYLTVETTNGTFTDFLYDGYGKRAESYDALWRFLHEVDTFSPSVISDFE